MDEKSKKYIELLCEALQLFYKNDAKALFKDHAADERAMVGCIYRYAWCLMHDRRFSGLGPDIDVEYDRMNSSEGDAVKKTIEFGICKERKPDCPKQRICVDFINEHCIKERCSKNNNQPEKYDFRPDIIIHRRHFNGSKDNGIDVEVKKDGAEKNRKDFDKAKVMFCTCQKADFKYKVGAVVILHKDKCDVTIYQNGKEVMMPFCVCEKDSLFKVSLLKSLCANG